VRRITSRCLVPELDGAFLDALLQAVPYRIHTVPIDIGIQFADLPKNRQGPTARFRVPPFDRVCYAHDFELADMISPGLTVVRQPIRDLEHQAAKILFERHRAQAHQTKPSTGLTPHEYICKCWQNDPTGLLSTQPIKCLD
jgi:hypothetical protein